MGLVGELPTALTIATRVYTLALTASVLLLPHHSHKSKHTIPQASGLEAWT